MTQTDAEGPRGTLAAARPSGAPTSDAAPLSPPASRPGPDSRAAPVPAGQPHERPRPRVIDFHTHAFPDDLAPRALEALQTPRYRPHTDGTVSGLVRSMDEAGVDAAVVCSIATAPKQMRPILEWSAAIASERLVPFASVHPEAEDPARAVREAARAGLKGIKLHPQYQRFFVDDPRVFGIYAAAADCGLVVLLHAGYDLAFPTDPRAQPHRIAAVARKFPGLRLVAAHLGGWKDWDAVLRHLAGTDVYLDTAFSVGGGEDDVPPDLLRRLLDSHSPDRLLFGTDSPWRVPAAEVRALRALDLPPEALAKVLGGNALRLLGLSTSGSG